MLRLYNTLNKRIERITPINRRLVKMYTCGPTVYRDAHIGNLRSYLMADWIRRILEEQGLQVVHVKNITDVGHMRQEILERGEDKVIAAAISEGKTPGEIADFYSHRFFADEERLKILPAAWFPKATDHIIEMIEIVELLIDRELAYEIDGNVYFSVSDFHKYGLLSGNVQNSNLLEAVRVEKDPLKRDPRDFTLWKRAEPGRELCWDSPWGLGFPGWHIECSAMSIKYLGTEFDIHTGGVDNIFPHHEGELAQSEGFTGNRVVNHWIHGQHLLADGVKMAKSSGNAFILSDIENQSIDPLAFRYLCMTARYFRRVNFTFTALKAAQRGLLRLYNHVWEWKTFSSNEIITDHDAIGEWKSRFIELTNNNLNLPQALSIMWRVVRSELPPKIKLEILLQYEKILGLGLDSVDDKFQIPSEVRRLIDNRSRLRENRQYKEADEIRDRLRKQDYVVRDTISGCLVRPKTDWEKREEKWATISSSSEVECFVDENSTIDFTVAIVVCNHLDDLKRCLASVFNTLNDRSAEILLIDNGSENMTAQWIEDTGIEDSRIKIVHSDHVLGEASAKNIALKQSRGKIIVFLDTSAEVTGDIFTPLQKILNDDSVGIVGPFGLKTTDLHHFHDGEGEDGDVDAMQAYCFAFKRNVLRDVGLMRESFRFYRNLDLDYSFQFKDKGYRILADPTLPVVRHEHRVWSEIPEGERDALSRKNYGRFLKKWGERDDLLVANRQTF